MSEVEIFLFKGFFTENSNTIELVKFSKEIQILHIYIQVVSLKMTSYKTMNQKNKIGKNKNPRF
jgi:hypothetical protein